MPRMIWNTYDTAFIYWDWDQVDPANVYIAPSEDDEGAVTMVCGRSGVRTRTMCARRSAMFSHGGLSVHFWRTALSLVRYFHAIDGTFRCLQLDIKIELIASELNRQQCSEVRPKNNWGYVETRFCVDRCTFGTFRHQTSSSEALTR